MFQIIQSLKKKIAFFVSLLNKNFFAGLLAAILVFIFFSFILKNYLYDIDNLFIKISIGWILFNVSIILKINIKYGILGEYSPKIQLRYKNLKFWIVNTLIYIISLLFGMYFMALVYFYFMMEYDVKLSCMPDDQDINKDIERTPSPQLPPVTDKDRYLLNSKLQLLEVKRELYNDLDKVKQLNMEWDESQKEMLEKREACAKVSSTDPLYNQKKNEEVTAKEHYDSLTSQIRERKEFLTKKLEEAQNFLQGAEKNANYHEMKMEIFWTMREIEGLGPEDHNE